MELNELFVDSWHENPSALRGRRVVIMGLGIQGGGLGVATYLRDLGVDLVVTDLRSEADLRGSVTRLGCEGVRYVLGRHEEDDFRGAELVVRNPAVPADSPYLRVARMAGARIETEMTLFLRWCPRGSVIGVTGTRGKTTTATALHAMLKVGGVPAVLAGNMGISALMSLSEAKRGGTVVLELSSAQIENLACTELCPHGAIVTNLMADHLDRYRDMTAYAAAKVPLVANQRADDWAVIPAMGGWSDWFADRASGTLVRPDLGKSPPGWDQALVAGRHNRENLGLAAAAARQGGVADADIATAIRQFSGVPARQEFLGTIAGVRVYNDTTSTIPEATLAAFASIRGPWVLIAGGSDKRLNFGSLAKWISEADGLRGVVLLPGTGTDRLRPMLRHSRVRSSRNMAEAVDRALHIAKADDALILSPACASFGLFANEFDRGNQFVACLTERGLRLMGLQVPT